MSERDVLIAAILQRLGEEIRLQESDGWWLANLHCRGLVFMGLGSTQAEAIKAVLWRVKGDLAQALDLMLSGGVDVVDLVQAKGAA